MMMIVTAVRSIATDAKIVWTSRADYYFFYFFGHAGDQKY